MLILPLYFFRNKAYFPSICIIVWLIPYNSSRSNMLYYVIFGWTNVCCVYYWYSESICVQKTGKLIQEDFMIVWICQLADLTVSLILMIHVWFAFNQLLVTWRSMKNCLFGALPTFNNGHRSNPHHLWRVIVQVPCES